MENQCKLEFYFRRNEMEKLLANNLDAEAIIVRQEVKLARAGRRSNVNIMEITAYALNSKKSNITLKATEQISIEGCPNPPGCTT